MIRTSTLTGSVPPTLSNSLSCKTRSNFTCKEGLMLPISSRKIDPLWACSNFPIRVWWAPVKAPFTCPNSSLSNKVSGMAPQLILTIFWSFRWLLKWIALAMSSFPVPVSPVTRTVLFVTAIVSTSWNMSCIGWLFPMMLSKRYFSFSWVLR